MLTFQECVEECLDSTDFVEEFDRLLGCCVGSKPRSPMDVLVDQATGYDEVKRKGDLKKFTAFVYETIWLRLPESSKDPTQIIEPPPGGSIEELLGLRENTPGVDAG